MKTLLLCATLLPVASLSNQAAPKPSPSAPRKAAPKKTPTQIKVDALWKQSDKAFHDGDYRRAIALHKQIVALEPDDIESYSVAAWLMWSLGDGEAATQHLFSCVRANPKSAEAWNALGQNYDLQKKFGNAKKSYQKALQLSSRRANTELLRRRLAHAARRSGDLETSISTWQSLARDYPNAVNKENLRRVQEQKSTGKTDD